MACTRVQYSSLSQSDPIPLCCGIHGWTLASVIWVGGFCGLDVVEESHATSYPCFDKSGGDPLRKDCCLPEL